MYPVKHRPWSPITEYALLLGSGAGAVVSLAAQNTVFASLPVTILVALGLLNRRRMDQSIASTQQSLQTAEEKVNKEIAILTDRVSTLPSPQVVASFQRAALNHSDRVAVRFSQALEQTKQDLEQRIEQMEAPDLNQLYQDTAQLQDQYTYVCTTLSNLGRQFERLSTISRLEATEEDVSQLKTELMQLRVNLETLTGDSRSSQATLQDAVRHLDRRLRQIPSLSDPNLIKGEVSALVRTVSDLVPRRDFSALSEKLQTIQETQAALRRSVDQLKVAPPAAAQNGHLPHRHPRFQALETEMGQLSSGLKRMETRLEDISVPFDITAEIRGTTATYLSSFQWQLAQLEKKTQELLQQQEAIDAVAATVEPPAAPAATSQWLMAMGGEPGGETSAVEQALFQALNDAKEQLILVWPWVGTAVLDGELIERFSDVLQRQCRLQIGWCHPSDRQEGRLLQVISQRWGLTTARQQRLKATLRQLLPLRKAFPDQFSFKVLGTEERFLVCDRAYAVVGLPGFTAESTALPDLDLRMKTTDPSVVSQLLQRFAAPDPQSENFVARLNRAATYYELQNLQSAIADFSYVLQAHPEHAIALNDRGVARASLKDYHRAMADFNAALKTDTPLVSTRCNRGWLLMQQGKFNQAIADFEWAINMAPTMAPTSAIAYFYRGRARQKLRDNLGAISDYTHAIHNSHQTAFLYYHRGAAYQHQGDIARAIVDLEMAASLLHSQGDHSSSAKITQILTNIRQEALLQPVQLHSA